MKPYLDPPMYSFLVIPIRMVTPKPYQTQKGTTLGVQASLTPYGLDPKTAALCLTSPIHPESLSIHNSQSLSLSLFLEKKQQTNMPKSNRKLGSCKLDRDISLALQHHFRVCNLRPDHIELAFGWRSRATQNELIGEPKQTDCRS